MDIILFMGQMLGVPSTLEPAIHESVKVAEAVMKVNGIFQSIRMQSRMNANEKQLQIIKNKIETSENEVYYKQEVFPLIVKQLINEDEDTKAKVIIDGFEYVVDNDLNEIEKLYHFYDVLDELRYSDIMFFVKKFSPTLESSGTQWDIFNDTTFESEPFNIYQLNKLIRLGLVESKVFNVDGGDFNDKGEMSLIGDKMIITPFGKRFFEFFTLEDEQA